MKQNIFYDLDKEECLLHYTTINEAIEGILDELKEDPIAIEICKYVSKEVHPSFLEGTILEHSLELLEEEFGNYDSDDVTEITEKMKEAEKAFINVLLEEYQPWQCEIVERKIINIAEWRKNNPQT